MINKFDGATRSAMIKIISEGIRTDETVETFERLEEFLLVPSDKACRYCFEQQKGVIINVKHQSIPEC